MPPSPGVLLGLVWLQLSMNYDEPSTCFYSDEKHNVVVFIRIATTLHLSS